MMKFIFFISLGFAFCLAPAVDAAEIFTSGQNIRALGMGGVRLSTGDEATVILWNPAGLSFSNGMRLDIFDINLGVNGLQNMEAIQDMQNRDGLDKLTPLYGKPIWLGLNGYTAVSLPHFGFALFNEGSADITVNNPTFPEMNVRYFNDYGYALGGAYNFGGLSFGAAVKRITRSGGYNTIGADLLENFDPESLRSAFEDEGVGYALDGGLMFKAPAPMSPTFSLAWQNIGRTEFTKTKGLRAPDGIRDNVTAGMSLYGDVGLAALGLGVEYRHINLPGEQLGKKIHLGAELSLLMLDLRAGFYQGYTTYGFGLDMFLFQIDAAMYSVERGAYPGQSPDQRIQIGISANLGFDPNFNLISIGRKGRKLKQRR